MKKILAIGLSLLMTLSVVESNPMDPKGRVKITKNEAEHIALQHFPHAQVKMAKLEATDGHRVWRVDLVRANGTESKQVLVDAVSGRIMSKAAAR